MTEREALKMALVALENTTPTGFNMERDKQFFAAITAIKEALAQPEQKPVAWRAWFDADNGARWLFSLWPEEERLNVEWTPLYTTPPQRKPLTRQQINQMMADAGWQNSAIRQANLDKVEKVARAIEAVYGIKE